MKLKAKNRIPSLEVSVNGAYKWLERMVNKDLFYHWDDDPAEVGNTVNGKWVKLFNEKEVFTLRHVLPVVRDLVGDDMIFEIPMFIEHYRDDGIDAAIRFGDGNFDDLNSVYLFAPKKFAVASPDYISEHGKLDDLTNPKQHRLINCQYGSKDLDTLCGQWEDVVATDYSGLEDQLINLPDDRQALNAAIHGRGIALTPNHLLKDDIEIGNIVYANNQPITFPGSYYFVSPIGVRPNSKLDAFRDWLVESSGELRNEEKSS